MCDEGALQCAATIEWLTQQGVVQRKVVQKLANLRLIRCNNRALFLEISAGKTAPIKLEIKDTTVHNKFMNEGKASIKFQASKCNVFISNAPTGQLFTFLRTLFVKISGQKSKENVANTSLRTQLLTNKKSKEFDEISPVTNGELEAAKNKISKASETTPSPGGRKRKLGPRDQNIKAPISKKLYAQSPVSNEPLDIDQKEILDACLAGNNVFFTGSAGTGKSYLLRRIIAALPPDATVATASTGVAACQIGGITLHQFAGIGDGSLGLERCVNLASRPASSAIWRKCKHLIVDEISMIDGEFFEKIEEIGRRIRRSEKPFGGIQLILCGDFFQLPPVGKDRNKPPKFCFQTSTWDSCALRAYELKRVYRQIDNDFIEMLNLIRLGRVPEMVTQRLMITSKQKIENNGILATRLCSHTNDANIINESKLQALGGEKKAFMAEDSDPGHSKFIDQQLTVPSTIELKIGAQVMLLKNISLSSGLVNGARGVVKSFKDGLPLIQFRTKEYLAKQERWSVKTASGAVFIRKQVPLKLAWAFSIHKSQGLTLDCVEMSLNKVFEAGQAYVALSRAQSLATLRVLDFKASQVWANKDVVEFYRNLNERMEILKFIPLGRKEVQRRKETKTNLKTLKLMSKPLISIN